MQTGLTPMSSGIITPKTKRLSCKWPKIIWKIKSLLEALTLIPDGLLATTISSGTNLSSLIPKALSTIFTAITSKSCSGPLQSLTTTVPTTNKPKTKATSSTTVKPSNGGTVMDLLLTSSIQKPPNGGNLKWTKSLIWELMLGNAMEPILWHCSSDRGRIRLTKRDLSNNHTIRTCTMALFTTTLNNVIQTP